MLNTGLKLRLSAFNYLTNDMHTLGNKLLHRYLEQRNQFCFLQNYFRDFLILAWKKSSSDGYLCLSCDIFRVSFLFPGAYFKSCFVAVLLSLLNWVEISHNRKPGKKETKNACFKILLTASSALLEKYSSAHNSMINNCRWYSKTISCHRIKDFSHGKWIGTMHCPTCSLFYH